MKKSTAAKATSRGYIEIDGSDPFNIPKHSKYIKGPTPEFSSLKDDKDFDEETIVPISNPISEHKEASSPGKQIENLDTEDARALGVGSDKDVEREKAMDKIYDSPKEEKEEDSPKEETSPKEDSISQEQAPVTEEDPSAALGSRNRMDLPDNTKHIQDIQQIFRSKSQGPIGSEEIPMQ